VEHSREGEKEPLGEETAPCKGFERGSGYADLVKEANRGHMDGCHTTIVEAVSVVGGVEVNSIQHSLRDPSPKSPQADVIKFERRRSLVNPLYEWKVYSRHNNSLDHSPI